MTVSPALSLFVRRASRWLAALLAVVAAGFAAAAAAMFFWVLPNISAHRDTVADLMSRALGQRVTLEAVSGSWQQARPEFRLRGVRLYDQQGHPALFLPELEAAFSWRSLLFLEPRFNRIELRGLTLGVRRARDGQRLFQLAAAAGAGACRWHRARVDRRGAQCATAHPDGSRIHPGQCAAHASPATARDPAGQSRAPAEDRGEAA